jgi:hypothetical protein
MSATSEPVALLNNSQYIRGSVTDVSTVMDGADNLDTFALGSDGAAYVNSQSLNGVWSGWKDLGMPTISVPRLTDTAALAKTGPVMTTGLNQVSLVSISAVFNGIEPMLFAIGANQEVFYTTQSNNGSWGGWTALGGGALSLTTTPSGGGSVDVFVIGTDHALYYNWQSSTNGSWSGWTGLGGYLKPSADFDPHGNLRVSGDARGDLDVFGIGSDNAVWYRSLSNGNWGAWKSLGGAVYSFSTVLDASGNLDVFAIGTNLTVFVTTQSPSTGNWSTWNNPWTPVTDEEWLSVNAVLDPRGDVDVFTIGTDGTLYYRAQSPGGSWGSNDNSYPEMMETGMTAKFVCPMEDFVRGSADVIGVGTDNAAYLLESAAYTPATGTLYGTSNSPAYADVKLGNLNDCWLAASLAEVAARAPSDIENMITYEYSAPVNGVEVNYYSVRFYDNKGGAHYFTVDSELPSDTGVYEQPVNGVFWVALIEKAYVEANAAGVVYTNHVGVDDYEVLNYGNPAWALQAITGQSATTTNSINTGDIATAWKAGQFILLSTPDSPPCQYLVPDHVYALVNYDAQASSPYEIFNPWGIGVNGWEHGPNSQYSIYSATSSFLTQNFRAETFGGSGNPMASAGQQTDLMVAGTATKQGGASDVLFSTLGAATGVNRLEYDGLADQPAPSRADSATQPAAATGHADFFRTMHKRAPVSDALFTDFASEQRV